MDRSVSINGPPPASIAATCKSLQMSECVTCSCSVLLAAF